MAKKKTKLNIDRTTSDWRNLVSCIGLEYDHIGYDLHEAALESEEGLENEHVIEACLDADRMKYDQGTDGARADAYVDTLIKEHGYNAVLSFLSEHIRLV